jgi:TetR/AcrR family tetracycline transcriptional repressor
VARPKVPLIAKRAVINQALAILDAEGMEALSIRRLGADLNVNGASLYHHFSNKDEILMAVGRAVLREVALASSVDDPMGWLLEASKRQRRVLLNHPNVIPLLSRGYLRTTKLPAYQTSREMLANLGISETGQAVLLEAIEAFTVGNVIVGLMPEEPVNDDGDEQAQKAAARARSRTAERYFETTLRGLIESAVVRYRI